MVPDVRGDSQLHCRLDYPKAHADSFICHDANPQISVVDDSGCEIKQIACSLSKTGRKAHQDCCLVVANKGITEIEVGVEENPKGKWLRIAQPGVLRIGPGEQRTVQIQAVYTDGLEGGEAAQIHLAARGVRGWLESEVFISIPIRLEIVRTWAERRIAIGFALGAIIVALLGWLMSRDHGPDTSIPPRTASSSYNEPRNRSGEQILKTETISGTITLVLPGEKFVFVRNSAGTSFKFVITASARIKVRGREADVEELVGETNKRVRVTFRAVRQGDIAQTIRVSQ
jgi:hypothetical protein